MIFWLLLGVLSLVCIALLLWPLRRHPAVSDELADTVRTDQVRRLTEFEDDLAAGEIDQSQSEAVLADIQRAAINANTPDTVPISSRATCSANRYQPKRLSSSSVHSTLP